MLIDSTPLLASRRVDVGGKPPKHFGGVVARQHRPPQDGGGPINELGLAEQFAKPAEGAVVLLKREINDHRDRAAPAAGVAAKQFDGEGAPPPVDQGPVQSRAGQPDAPHVGPKEPRPAKARPSKVGLAEIGPAEIRSTKIGADQAGPNQGRPPEIRVVEAGEGKLGLVEVRSAKVHGGK